MQSIAIRELRNNPSHLTQSLERDEYVFITKHGKPIGVAVPLSNDNLRFGLTRATALQAWKQGELSLGKMAELLQIDKVELRAILSAMHLPMLDESVDEAIAEAQSLLDA
ncbi:MAG TPA: type II toxin-antitoxin system prevent-host-death family antitoxin [Leucothrix mucor]|nr:type II toxin-antitoxin system prevent-host-death family antitoxin [Leucothrix mucor]